MRVGVITGSGTYALPDFEGEATAVATPWGEATVTVGPWHGHEVLHVSRHEVGHRRLSNHVTFRENAWALKELGAEAAIGCTACGTVDPTVPLGSLVVFDDLHFVVNRLPDGAICTVFDAPGDPARGHWIYERPFSAEVRAAVLAGARAGGLEPRDGGVYGHVDGPRFNTAAEIRGLASCGVTAVSQTGGPETVLLGELEIPYALVGWGTDHANGVVDVATPVADLVRRMGEGQAAFATMLARALPALTAAGGPAPAGVVFRFDEG